MWILLFASFSPACAPTPSPTSVDEWRQSVDLDLAPVEGAFRYRGEPYAQEGLRRELRIKSDTRWRDAALDGERPRTRRDLLRVRGELEILDHDDAPAEWSKPMQWQAPLEGTTVILYEDGSEPEFHAEQLDGSPASDLDADLLGALAIHDFSAFLPSPAAEDAQPAVEPTALDALLAPLGDAVAGTRMRHTFLAGGISGFTSPLPPLDLAPFLGGEYEGTVKANRDDASDGLTVVTLEIDVRIETDRADWLQELLDPRMRTEVERYELTLELEGTGTLRFDAEAGTLVDAELELDVGCELHASWEQDGETLEAELGHEGELAVEISAPR